MAPDLRYEHLLGRQFEAGAVDCFDLARQFYIDNFGIEVPDFARPHDWSADERDLLRLLHEKAGFEMVTHWRPQDLRPGDVLCLCIGEANPNHVAVITGDGNILHHLRGRLSQAEPWADFWRRHVAFVLRHPKVPDLRPVLPEIDLAEMLDARQPIPSAAA